MQRDATAVDHQATTESSSREGSPMAQQTSCPSCSSDDLIIVELIPQERPMMFHTCRRCEVRWWEDVADGIDLDLTVVLDLIAG